MKKTILSLAALLGVAGTAQAQLHSRGAVSIGLKAGGTVTTFVGQDTPKEKATYGFLAGLAFHIGAEQGFYVQPEILYSQKGSKEQDSFYDTNRHLSYLDIPVAFRYQSNDFFLELGPQVGFLLSADEKRTDIGDKVNIKDSYNTIDAGYLLGVGYQPEDGGFGLGARYNGGLLRVPKDKPNAGLPATEISQRNSAFQLYATYFFKQKRHHR